jgi:hypothetical protein
MPFVGECKSVIVASFGNMARENSQSDFFPARAGCWLEKFVVRGASGSGVETTALHLVVPAKAG